MKQVRTIFLILLVILMSAGCSLKQTNTPDTTAVPSSPDGPKATEAPGTTQAPVSKFDPETDFDNRFGMNYDKLFETEGTYYFSAYNSAFLYYFDKASGDRGVLCPRPECMHDEGKDDGSCNGHIATIGASLNYWGGRLHYYSTDQPPYNAVFSMALDGSDRTKDLYINISSITPHVTPQRLDYHRGKLYGYDLRETVIDGEPFKRMIVFSIDAETGEFREIYSALTNNGGLTEPYIVYKQNFVYISYDEYTVAEEYKLDTFTWHLLQWSIDAEEIEEIVAANAEDLDDTALEHYICVGDDGRIWFAPQSNNLTAPLKVYLLEDGQISDAFRFDNTGVCFIVQDAAVNIFIFEKRWEVRRLDGSLIYMGELDTSWLDGLDEEMSYSLDAISSIMGTADEVFISFYVEADDGSGTERICLVRYDMTGEKPVPTLIANARWN